MDCFFEEFRNSLLGLKLFVDQLTNKGDRLGKSVREGFCTFAYQYLKHDFFSQLASAYRQNHSH